MTTQSYFKYLEINALEGSCMQVHEIASKPLKIDQGISDSTQKGSLLQRSLNTHSDCKVCVNGELRRN